jgi:SAM-dependent methyltransferase
MSDEKLPERIMAELYDRHSSEFYDYHAKRGDVKFYVDCALESGGPVLELGCGTGRILIPTSRAGVRITGLDKSAEMLRICHDKLEKEALDVRERVKLINADMLNFTLGRQFSMVTIAFGPFNNLVSVEEQISCLKCINEHLRDNGTLVFDVMYWDLRTLPGSEGKDIVSVKTPFEMPDGRSVTWGIHRQSVDYNRQVTREELIYNIRYPDGRREQMVYPESLRYFFRFEVEHLLARTGFKTEAVYADFDRTHFGAKYPSELIFLARKE